MNSPQRASLRLQDVLLVVLFIALAVITTEHDPSEIALILLLGALQLTESRLIPLDTVRGKVIWNVVKLAAGYVLIGYTGGVQSSYYLVLLFPVISAAASLGVINTLAFTALSCAAYLSFLLYVNWTTFYLDAEAIAELERRVLILGIAGMLVNTLAEALRSQYLQLKEANRSLRAAEEQVRRSERLAALGQLTAGLAHELRNPLGTIKGSANVLEKQVAAGNDVARELAGYISSEVDRTNSLVSRFLDFARPLALKRASADLEKVVRAAITAVSAEARERGVELQSEFSSHHLTFDFDAELMERVFFNLIQNAIQASHRGAVVRIESGSEAGNAVVRVTDNGAGIEPDQIETIFNPFVTTKSEGTGLGLAIVAKVVDEHRGKVTVSSTPAQGAVFTVSLPLNETA